MKKILFLLIFLAISFGFENNINYVSVVQKEKYTKIKDATDLYQYLYDLKKLKEILQLLNKNPSFKEASETAEMNIKNIKSLNSNEYIKSLLKVLKGENCNKGYIQDIKDKFTLEYEIYLNNYPYKKLITKNLDAVKNRIEKTLKKLQNNLKNETDIKPDLNKIFANLIILLKEIKEETLNLKNKNIIKPFNLAEDKKYCIPANWAQPDGNTTLSDIINFILNGDKKHNLYGIKEYYKNFYQKPNPFTIIH